jgi:hypothetical protein
MKAAGAFNGRPRELRHNMPRYRPPFERRQRPIAAIRARKRAAEVGLTAALLAGRVHRLDGGKEVETGRAAKSF